MRPLHPTQTGFPVTDQRLELEGRRMRAALDQIPPDRVEAAKVQDRVDRILDNRPNVRIVASDGEVVWDENDWISEQAKPMPEGFLDQFTAQEPLSREELEGIIGRPDDVDTNSGGVALLEQPEHENPRDWLKDERDRRDRRQRGLWP